MEGKRFFEESKVLVPYLRLRFTEPLIDDEFMKQIDRLQPQSLPEGKKVILHERSDEAITKNPYGERITYLISQQFRGMRLPTRGDSKLSGIARKWDEAVLMFLKNIPDDTPILIFWH